VTTETPTAIGAHAPELACRFRDRLEQNRIKEEAAGNKPAASFFSASDEARKMPRMRIADLKSPGPKSIVLKGWIRRIRETKSTTFIVLQDCSGTIQVVAGPVLLRNLGLRAESAVAIEGTARRDERAPGGVEFDADEFTILNQSAENLPFTSVSRLDQLSPDLVIDYRPLALRTDRGAAIFRIEAALAEAFRAALRKRRFTEIFTSKIVANATEGGSTCSKFGTSIAQHTWPRVRNSTRNTELSGWNACSKPVTYTARSRTLHRVTYASTTRWISKWDSSRTCAR
jgi:aspartyl/asparaginyl-tRNA synthetase